MPAGDVPSSRTAGRRLDTPRDTSPRPASWGHGGRSTGERKRTHISTADEHAEAGRAAHPQVNESPGDLRGEQKQMSTSQTGERTTRAGRCVPGMTSTTRLRTSSSRAVALPSRRRAAGSPNAATATAVPLQREPLSASDGGGGEGTYRATTDTHIRFDRDGATLLQLDGRADGRGGEG